MSWLNVSPLNWRLPNDGERLEACPLVASCFAYSSMEMFLSTRSVRGKLGPAATGAGAASAVESRAEADNRR